MQLVLFDFDGTITRKDSLWEFLFFSKGLPGVMISVLVLFPLFVLYGLRIVNGGYLKERMLRWHFKGEGQSEMERLAREFSKTKLNTILRSEVMKQFIAYKEQGDEVCVVTASCDIWIKPFCDEYKCSYLATQLEFVNGVFSGKFSTPNCNGEEKPKRIRSAYDLRQFSKIIAFGNSSDDLPMFSLANEIHKIR